MTSEALAAAAPAAESIAPARIHAAIPQVDATRSFPALVFLRGALIALAVALAAEVLAVGHYLPGLAPRLEAAGLSFAALRPLHTIFATAWIFLAGLAVVQRWLAAAAGSPGAGERVRLRVHVICWAAAGLGVLVTLPLGITSGREYLEQHPLISALILLGWLLAAFDYLRFAARGFLGRPVYVAMWTVGFLFFAYTFLEQHAWLLPGVFADPIVDLRVQWKACGTLVGSFNLFVYGAILWCGERLSGDGGYARSRMAWALFGVGLLNSFTNFAHHTYHLPQSALVKWISFVVSMTEALILLRVLVDVARMVRRRGGAWHGARFFLGAAKWWTAGLLASAILISIPPLNTLIHGTQVVTAHAMGAEIGVDSMALFAALTLLLEEALTRHGRPATRLHARAVRRAAVALNVAAAFLVLWLTLAGSVTGVRRYGGLAPPEWLTLWSPWCFAAAGSAFAVCLALLLRTWFLAAFRDLPWRPTPRS